jgi:hypothetical protein
MIARRPARARTERQRAARGRAFRALSLKREQSGISLSRAAMEEGTTVATIRRYAPSTVYREGERDRWKVKKSDRLRRDMPLVTNRGVEWVTTNSSRQASLLGRYNNDVHFALEHDDDDVLLQYRGVVVAGYELETDLDVLRERRERGELDYEISSGER